LLAAFGFFSLPIEEERGTSHLAAMAATATRAACRAFGRRALSAATSPVPETMSYLRDLRSGSEVYLVGTAHISRKSADEVRSVIRSVKPDVVFVELCRARAEAMRAARSGARDDPAGALPEPLRQLLRSLGAPGDLGEKLLGAGLKAVYQLLRQFHGLDPGLEFKVAMDECDASGARLVLGDRDQDATIRALRDAIDLADVLKLLAGGGAADPDALDPELASLFQNADWRDPARAVETLKTRKATAAMAAAMRAQFPKVANAMLDQRDDVMTERLLEAARERGEEKIVAVVGMAHMDGIETRWGDAQGDGLGVTRISGG
jgi:pheromone shutdown protein TraB